MYDVAIIGKGPAGMTAAIYFGRANKKTIIFGKKNEIWNKSVIINNYFGVGEIDGESLMKKGEEQVRSFNVEIVDDFVVGIKNKMTHFVVETKDKSYEAKNIILAVGAPKRKKEIENEEEYVGKGVSYCVPCDGFFFKGKKVVVVGNTDYTLSEAKELLNYTKDITIMTNGKEPEFLTNEFKIDKRKIVKIVGEDKVDVIETEDGTIKVDGIFIASGNAGASELAMMVGVLIDEENKIVVDNEMKTNIPHIWAAGDCTPGPQQIGKAVGEAIVAAFSIMRENR